MHYTVNVEKRGQYPYFTPIMPCRLMVGQLALNEFMEVRSLPRQPYLGSSMVEHSPVKRDVGGSTPSLDAKGMNAKVARIPCTYLAVGSIPTISTNAPIAQLVEHPTCNREVAGSTPAGCSIHYDLGSEDSPKVFSLVRFKGSVPKNMV